MKRIVKYTAVRFIEEVRKNIFLEKLEKITESINDLNKDSVKNYRDDSEFVAFEIKDIKYGFTENEQGGATYTAILIIDEVLYFDK